MEISIVKNCVRRVENSTANVKVANRINANGKKERINIYDSISAPGLTIYAEGGNVFGKLGREIGTVSKGRVCVSASVDGKIKRFYRSRLVMEAILGRKLRADEEVDHINNITTDDRIENLRIVDRKSNMNNPLTKALRKNKSPKRHSLRIELIGGAAAAARPERTYKIEKVK